MKKYGTITTIIKALLEGKKLACKYWGKNNYIYYDKDTDTIKGVNNTVIGTYTIPDGVVFVPYKDVYTDYRILLRDLFQGYKIGSLNWREHEYIYATKEGLFDEKGIPCTIGIEPIDEGDYYRYEEDEE